MADVRNIAVKILTKLELQKAYSSIAVSDLLKNYDVQDKRDTSFIINLVYGVLEHKLTLDYNIGLYLTGKTSKLKNDLLNILRVGAFQILYLDKIPVSASVNEAVKSAKKNGCAYASGMVNAVLRKISKNGIILPEGNDIEYLSIKYSVSPSIVRMLTDDYDKNTVISFFEAFEGRRPIYIRRNILKCTEEQMICSLVNCGVEVKKTNIDNCYSIAHSGDITKLEAFSDGWFYVQDMSSQICCKLLGAKKGDFVVDCCAAPGGKSFTISQYIENEGTVISCDIHEHKTLLIKKTSEKLGLSVIDTVCSDARELNQKGYKADKVLCDVPCSGLGVMGRKPEIRYKSAEELKNLPELQKEILFSCAEMVKDGGTLIYSTCTLNKSENEEVCEAFLREFPDFSISSDSVYRELTDRFLTVFPDKNGGDGFFIAKFVRGKI